MRSLARHQWVRDHGTPRVSTLAGPIEVGRAEWCAWMAATKRVVDERVIFAEPVGAADGWLATAAARALELATSAPREPVAIMVAPASLSRWLGSRMDRLTALIGEGVVEVEVAATRPRSHAAETKARSSAEQAMLEALEATPSTAGRFQLNQTVSFAFGSKATEIDLLSRADDLAIEIDGYHHFTEAARYRRDRRKDLLLQANGYVVLRFLADDVLADAASAVREVVLMLGVKRGHDTRRNRSKRG